MRCEITCANCGKTFTCGAATGSCWCMELPRTMPMPADLKSGCLCGECLTMKQFIQHLPAAHVAFLRHVGPYGPAIKPLWMKLGEWAASQNLWAGPVVMYGISHDNPRTNPPEQCRYDACFEVPLEINLTGQVQSADLPGGLYAVLPFEGKGPEIGAGFERLMDQIIPETAREFDPARPIFELYRGANCAKADGTLICDLCVPVK